MEMLLFITGSDILRYFYGPLPQPVCFVKTTLNSSIVLQIGLFITAIVFTKYIFIFHLKNPTAIDDKFWTLYITLWIRMLAYLCIITSTLMPGNQSS